MQSLHIKGRYLLVPVTESEFKTFPKEDFDFLVGSGATTELPSLLCEKVVEARGKIVLKAPKEEPIQEPVAEEIEEETSKKHKKKK